MIDSATKPKFIGGCKDGDDASECRRSYVDVIYYDRYHIASKDSYRRQPDGDYLFIESQHIGEIIREARLDV
jgi:hypothetical protein